MARRLAIHLNGHMLGKTRGFDAGPITVQGRIIAAAGIDVITDVTGIRFNHVATEAMAHHLEPTEHFAHRPAEGILVPGMRSFERLEHAPPVVLLRGEVKRKPRRCAFEPAMNMTMFDRPISPLIAVDVGFAEILICDDVGGSFDLFAGGFLNCAHYMALPRSC